MKQSNLNIVIPLKDGKSLLHNTCTQGSLLLENSQLTYLSHPLTAPILLKLRLQSIGAILNTDIDEITVLRKKDFISKKYKEKSLSITVMMTEACNFSCSYCNQGTNKQSKFLDSATFSKLVSYIQSFPDCEKLEVSWYGGEPLLRKKDIAEFSSQLLSHCISKQIIYESHITTNGYFLTLKAAEMLIKSGIKAAQITIDGDQDCHDNSRYIKEGHGSFELIMNNIKSVLENTELKIIIRTNVNKLNMDGLFNMIDQFIGFKFNHSDQFAIYFYNVYSPSKNQLEDSLYSDVDENLLDPFTFSHLQYKLNCYLRQNNFNIALDMPSFGGSCIATKKSSFAISPYGELFKCYVVMANRDEAVGTLSNEGAPLLDKSKFDTWNNWTAFEQEECRGCKLIGSCRGGCPLDYIQNNSHSNNFRCPPSKLYFNEYVFSKAVQNGLVQPELWDEKLSKTNQHSLRL